MTQLLPKISIITPSFNQGQFIEETILSVINQNYPNLEYIIIDGGSTDNTVEIIKKYENKINYWISEKDSGQSEAINKGINKTTGQILTWLNSDDVYLPNTLIKIAEEFLKQPQLGLLHGKTVVFGENLKDRIVGGDTDIPQYQYLATMKFPQPSSFFSKEALDAIGPVSNHLHFGMDFELVAKLVLQDFKIQHSNDIFSRYRMHKNSKSHLDLKFLEDWAVVVYQVFQSLSNGHFFADELIKLELVKSYTSITYPCKIALSKNELEEIFLEHLHLHYHFLYRLAHFKQSKKISQYLKKNHPNYFNKMKFYKYDLRASLIPVFLFKLLKKL